MVWCLALSNQTIAGERPNMDAVAAERIRFEQF